MLRRSPARPSISPDPPLSRAAIHLPDPPRPRAAIHLPDPPRPRAAIHLPDPAAPGPPSFTRNHCRLPLAVIVPPNLRPPGRHPYPTPCSEGAAGSDPGSPPCDDARALTFARR